MTALYSRQVCPVAFIGLSLTLALVPTVKDRHLYKYIYFVLCTLYFVFIVFILYFFWISVCICICVCAYWSLTLFLVPTVKDRHIYFVLWIYSFDSFGSVFVFVFVFVFIALSNIPSRGVILYFQKYIKNEKLRLNTLPMGALQPSKANLEGVKAPQQSYTFCINFNQPPF